MAEEQWPGLSDPDQPHLTGGHGEPTAEAPGFIGAIAENSIPQPVQAGVVITAPLNRSQASVHRRTLSASLDAISSSLSSNSLIRL